MRVGPSPLLFHTKPSAAWYPAFQEFSNILCHKNDQRCWPDFPFRSPSLPWTPVRLAAARRAIIRWVWCGMARWWVVISGRVQAFILALAESSWSNSNPSLILSCESPKGLWWRGGWRTHVAPCCDESPSAGCSFPVPAESSSSFGCSACSTPATYSSKVFPGLVNCLPLDGACFLTLHDVWTG